jgi:hypothetical protein
VPGFSRSAPIHGVESQNESFTTSIMRTYLPGVTGNSGTALGSCSCPLSGQGTKSQ